MLSKLIQIIACVLVLCGMTLHAMASSPHLYTRGDNCSYLLKITQEAYGKETRKSLKYRFLAAILKGDVKEVKQLVPRLKQSASGRELIQDGLSEAAWAGKPSVVKVLLHAGASADAPDKRLPEKPLVAAAACGHVKVMEILVSHGARVMTAPPANGGSAADNAFEYAVMNDQSASAKWLLDNGFSFCVVENKVRQNITYTLAKKQKMPVAKELVCKTR